MKSYNTNPTNFSNLLQKKCVFPSPQNGVRPHIDRSLSSSVKCRPTAAYRKLQRFTTSSQKSQIAKPFHAAIPMLLPKTFLLYH